MSNPNAQYKVRFDGHVLPGYLQNEDIPLESRDGRVGIINRDGGPIYENGTNFRGVILHFNVLSRLNSNNPGIAHLGDCLEQYRDALRFVTRTESSSTLFFGETSHYLVAKYTRMSAPMVAPDSKRIGYNVEFTAEPWFYGPAVSSSDSISGDDTIVLSMPDTRKTYPIFTIPSGITCIAISHAPSGKSFMISGSHATSTVVDCGRLTAVTLGGTNQISKILTGPDFGIYHVGSGSCTFDVSNVIGSGLVTTIMVPRLER
jgi:hypothetical protein